MQLRNMAKYNVYLFILWNLNNETQEVVFLYPGLMENHIVSGTYFTKGMREKDKFTTLLGETIQVDSIKGMYRMSVSLSVRLFVCLFIHHSF